MTLPPTSLSVDPEVCVSRDGQAEKSQLSQGFRLDSVTAVDVTCSVVIIGQPVCSPESCSVLCLNGLHSLYPVRTGRLSHEAQLNSDPVAQLHSGSPGDHQ